MNKVIRSNVVHLPYSLHDRTVIGFEVANDILRMQFQDGFVKTIEPFEQIDGSIEFEKIDWDFSFVYLLEYQNVLCGNVGCFTGSKMNLKDFINHFNEFTFEVVDETYGFNTSKFDGYFSGKDEIKECMIEIYHLGDMSYIVKE